MDGVAAEIAARAARVRVVALDVDGVLTDGRLVLASDGSEARSFYVRDGLAIRLAQEGGLRFAIVSGRDSEVVRARAAELKIAEVHQGVLRKLEVVRGIAERAGVGLSEIAFIGDDLIDLPVLRAVGLAAAPADADPEVLRTVHWVSDFGGGHGAVRQTVELILRSAGRWESLIDEWFGPGRS